MNQIAVTLMAMIGLCGTMISGNAAERGVSNGDWTLYKAQFISSGGRIIDNANGNISHSEGQGYGLLLAFLANNPGDFERIWHFTKSELLIRDDGLAAWRWDPASKPHVTDINNASDGDLLISYALALAGFTWQNEAYLEAATDLARALLEHVIISHGGQTILLPGVTGFSAQDRADGPVVNPSYWVFEALPVMNALVPSPKWEKLYTSGLALLQKARFGPRKLPSDWISLAATSPEPADGFEPEFGYNSIRIPLYLIRANIKNEALLNQLQKGVMEKERGPFSVNVESGALLEELKEPGYQLINHMMSCFGKDKPIPAASRKFNPEFYYPSTLQLLGLAYVKEKRSECLVSRSSSLPR